MTNDTSMIRLRTQLRDELKTLSVREGRTLEWMLNDAVEKYLSIPQIPIKAPSYGTLESLQARQKTIRDSEPWVEYDEG